jgi:hypothetical protein
MSWKPGDRVKICLPIGPGNRKGPALGWVSGIVREVDPPGLRPGVRVDLDHPVRGVSNCFATHAELRPEM